MRPIVGPWYRVTLPLKESGAGGKVMLLQDAFDAAFIANSLPENAAMFGRCDEDPKNYAGIYVYDAYVCTLDLPCKCCLCRAKSGARRAAGRARFARAGELC